MNNQSNLIEKKIYYAKKKKIIENLILIVALITGVYFLLLPDIGDERYFGLLLIGVAAFYLYVNGKIDENREPQIVINSEGIQISTCDFRRWAEISNVNIVSSGGNGWSLLYDYPNGKERFSIGNLDIKQKELKNLIENYSDGRISVRINPHIWQVN